MISFIKENSNTLILLLLLFITVDSFLLIVKFTKRSESLPKLTISYDIFNSYCLDFFLNAEYKLAVIYLTLENTSINPVDITNIKLIDRDKSYLAILPEINDIHNMNGISLVNEDKTKVLNLNISSDNILQNPSISPYDTLIGYAVFEDFPPILAARDYRLIIETPSKVFETEITLKPLEEEFHPIHDESDELEK